MILNGKVINPGELRTLVEIQRRTTNTEQSGFQVPVWAKVSTVYSKWVNAHGPEVVQAQAAKAQYAATVLIRYQSGIDNTCAVVKGTERYEIVSVDDIQERHEYIELKVQRMEAG
jgi:SPP1 family predicted phage head-tail adaptor